MDILTQGLAGGVFAQSAADTKHKRPAALSGLVAGLLPDLDILIRSSHDPLLSLEFHRQFTHALIFIPAGAFIAMLLLWPFMKSQLDAKRLYLFCLLGYSTGGLLDACTSFGTQLLWPFSDTRIAWNLLSIIDPVFTLMLLAAFIIGWFQRSSKSAIWISILAPGYLLLALSQQQAATQAQQEIASSRSHRIERAVIKPTLGNIILWRSVYLADNQYHVDAIRVLPFGKPALITGASIDSYPLPVNPADSRQTLDIQRFHKLSQGYLVQHPKYPDVIGDIRYAMLPDSIEPLWGIRLDPNQAESHVAEVTFRQHNKETRTYFIRMLTGNH